MPSLAERDLPDFEFFGWSARPGRSPGARGFSRFPLGRESTFVDHIFRVHGSRGIASFAKRVACWPDRVHDDARDRPWARIAAFAVKLTVRFRLAGLS